MESATNTSHDGNPHNAVSSSDLTPSEAGKLPIPPTLREMPPSNTYNGAMVAETRREVASDPNLQRLWDMPSLMVAGITYRKVTESVTLPDGRVYQSVVEELHRSEEPEESHRKRNPISLIKKSH